MKVLIATDGSEYSNAAIDKCFELLKTESISVKVVSVMEPPLTMSEPFGGSVEFYREAEDAVRQQAESAAAQAENRIRERFGSVLAEAALTSEVMIGSPVRRIVEEAQKWEADLIVVGSHGYGFWERMMLGSVSQSIAHHAPCSVLVVRKDKGRN